MPKRLLRFKGINMAADNGKYEEDPKLAPASKSASVNLSFKWRVIISMACYMTSICYGIRNEIVGPVLVDMQMYTGSSISSISLVFTFTAVAAFFGTILLGPLHDKFNSFILQVLCMLLMSAFLFAAPWSRSVIAFIVLNAINVFFLPSLTTGNLIILTSAWKESSAPALQGEGIFYAIGKTLASLLAMPFLSPESSQHKNDVGLASPSISTSDSPLLNNLSTILNDIAYNYPQNRSNNRNDNNCTSNTSSCNSTDYLPYDTNVQYVFVINSLLFLLTAVFVFLLFWRVAKCDHRQVMVQQTELQTEYSLAKDSITDQQKRTMKLMTIAFYGATFVFCFFLTSIEIVYPSFLLTFTNKFLGWDKESGALLTTSFDAGGVILSIISIILTIFIRNVAALMTIYLSLVVTAATALLFLYDKHYIVIWLSTITIGAGIHPILGLLAAYSSSVLPLSGRYQTMIWTGSCLSGLCFPILVAWLMEHVSGLWYVYIALINSLATVLSYIGLRISGWQILRIQKETAKLNLVVL